MPTAQLNWQQPETKMFGNPHSFKKETYEEKGRPLFTEREHRIATSEKNSTSEAEITVKPKIDK